MKGLRENTMGKLVQQFMKFGVVGVIAFVIDYGLMVALTELAGVNYLISATISFTVSVVFNYLASMRYVFTHKQGLSRRREFVIFVVLSVIGLGVNDLLMWLGSSVLGVSYLIVKIVATAIVMVYNFVTRKITLAASRIAQGFQDKLYLGNLNALRDWGYAKDYIECMWLILQQEQPEDFVIATGEYHTVRDFATLAFHHAGIELEWQGEGLNEKGIDRATGRVLVEVDPKYFRPAEVEQLLGDPTKAKEKLGWNPHKTSFEELVRIMVEHDMRFVRKLYLKAQMPE